MQDVSVFLQAGGPVIIRRCTVFLLLFLFFVFLNRRSGMNEQ